MQGYGVYVKLFTSIFDGSLYGKFEPTVTFIAMLALADEKGVVDMTPEAIAAKSGFPLDIVRTGIEQLELPDPRSRTKTEECQGRRILRLDPERDWGWLITNYTKYRQIRTAEERREYFRQYKAQARAAQKSAVSTESTEVHPKPPILDAEAESYAEAEKDLGPAPIVASPKPKRSPRVRSSIPADFRLDERMVQYALDRLPDMDTEASFRDFRDYHLAKGDVAADWGASWRTWVNNCWKGFSYVRRNGSLENSDAPLQTPAEWRAEQEAKREAGRA